MEVATKGNCVELIGFLNEKSDMEPIKAAFEAVRRAHPNERLLLDFSKIDKANSCGILAYLRMFIALGIPATYVNAPIWLVEQFNALDDFFEGDVLVSSIHAQFYSPSTDETLVVLQQIGKDIPVLKDYADFTIEAKGANGDPLEPDYDPEMYYSFIAKRFGAFSAGIK